MISKKTIHIILLTFFSSAIYSQQRVEYKYLSKKVVFPGCKNKKEKELDQCNLTVSYNELLKQLITSEEIFEKIQKQQGGIIIKLNISKKGKVKPIGIYEFLLSKSMEPIVKSAASQMFGKKGVVAGKINHKKVNTIYTLYIEFPLALAAKQPTIEEVCNELETLKSPKFDSVVAQKFSIDYIRFLKGFVGGIFLRDKNAMHDWELFFKKHKLSKVPQVSQISENDKYKLVYIMGKIDQIKKYIKK